MRSSRQQSPALIIGVLAVAGMIGAGQQTLVVPVLPEIPELFGTTDDNASWLVTATVMMGAVLTPILTRMADLFGRRRMFVVSLAVLIAGSIVVAFSTELVLAVIGRGIMGAGVALIPIGIGILRDTVPVQKMRSGIALISGTAGFGAALGMPLSGILYDGLGWSWLFLFVGIVTAVLAIVTLIVVPNTPVAAGGRFDVVGALLLTAILTAFLLAVSKSGSWGLLSPQVLALLGGSAVLLAIWIPLQLRAKSPMVDLRMAVQRNVLLTNIAALLGGVGVYANMLVTSQLLQLPEETGFGLAQPIVIAGLAMAPSGLAMLLVSPLNGWMLNRWGGKPVLVAGAAIMAVSYVWRVWNSANVAEVILGNVFIGLGAGLVLASMPALIVAAVPIEATSSANGVNQLVRAIGAALASAVVGAFLTAITVQVAGTTWPGWGAIVAIFWIAAACSLAAAIIALLIPRAAAEAS